MDRLQVGAQPLADRGVTDPASGQLACFGMALPGPFGQRPFDGRDGDVGVAVSAGRRLDKGGPVALDHPFQHVAEVPQQVPSIGHLHRVRRTATSARRRTARRDLGR